MSCSDFGIVEKMPLLFVGPTETVSPQFVPVLTAPAPVGLMPIANAADATTARAATEAAPTIILLLDGRRSSFAISRTFSSPLKM